MKKLLTLCLALMLVLPAMAAEKYPETLETNVGRGYIFTPSTRGTWASSDPAVAQVDLRGNISFLSVGEATVTHTARNGKETSLAVTVREGGQIPAEVQAGVDFALKEWQEANNESFPRSNKYTFWLRNAKSTFGWCGAFANYSLDMAGVPMERRNETVLQTDGRAYAVHEAAVPKIWESFTKMDRIAFVPQVGYEVIYGKRGSTPYIHLGLVTRVEDLGEGLYLLETVEGNMDNRILRYSYIYNSLAEDKDRNYYALPEAQQTQPDIFKYQPHNKGGWYITAFGATWY